MGDHLKMRELARELIRDSIVEDALAQFVSLALEHVHDERIKPLRAEVDRLRAELSGAADVFAGIADHILSAKGTDVPPNHKGIFADCQRAGMKIRAAIAKREAAQK